MVRVRMPLKLIEGERHRNEIFMRRREVIKKKAMELGKLCDVVTLLVCYGPRGQLETWPQDHGDVREIIERYRRPPEPDAAAKGVVKYHRYDVASFFECHLKKLQAELARVRDAWLDAPLLVTAPEGRLEELAQSLDAKLADIDERIARRLEEAESWGKEIELWLQHEESLQPQHQLMQNPLASAGSPPLDAVLDSQRLQSIEGLEYYCASVVKPEEQFRGDGLQGHVGTSADAVAARGHPHDRIQRSTEIACNLPRPTPPDAYMLPSITAQGLSMDTGYLDDLINPSAFLSMDLTSYPAAPGTASSSSAVGVHINPTATAPFPYSLICHDGLVGRTTAGMINPAANMSVPPFDRPVDAGYGFFLHHLPPGNPSAMCNQVCYPNDQQFYGAGFSQGMQNSTGQYSLGAETWSTSINFHDLKPPGCGGTNSTARAVARPGGGDGSTKFLRTSSTYGSLRIDEE